MVTWWTSLEVANFWFHLHGGSLSCPRLTGHLCKASQATTSIVHQQYSARAQLDASQEQLYHVLKLTLLYAACRTQALLPYVSRLTLPVTKTSGCSPNKDSSQSTAQPASAISTSSGYVVSTQVTMVESVFKGSLSTSVARTRTKMGDTRPGMNRSTCCICAPSYCSLPPRTTEENQGNRCLQKWELAFQCQSLQ